MTSFTLEIRESTVGRVDRTALHTPNGSTSHTF
jgi:hypothetical protein